MSTPPSERPRLPDDESAAIGDEPDLDRDNVGGDKSRIPHDEKDERIPDEDE